MTLLSPVLLPGSSVLMSRPLSTAPSLYSEIGTTAGVTGRYGPIDREAVGPLGEGTAQFVLGRDPMAHRSARSWRTSSGSRMSLTTRRRSVATSRGGCRLAEGRSPSSPTEPQRDLQTRRSRSEGLVELGILAALSVTAIALASIRIHRSIRA
jgi:hypothetical protein